MTICELTNHFCKGWIWYLVLFLTRALTEDFIPQQYSTCSKVSSFSSYELCSKENEICSYNCYITFLYHFNHGICIFQTVWSVVFCIDVSLLLVFFTSKKLSKQHLIFHLLLVHLLMVSFSANNSLLCACVRDSHPLVWPQILCSFIKFPLKCSFSWKPCVSFIFWGYSVVLHQPILWVILMGVVFICTVGWRQGFPFCIRDSVRQDICAGPTGHAQRNRKRVREREHQLLRLP